MDIITAVSVCLVALGLTLAFGFVTVYAANLIRGALTRRRVARVRRLRSERERKQRELRAAIYRLAQALSEEQAAAEHAKRGISQALYVARGELPPT
ncbi:hypothetical protein LQ938_11455 [Microbacterium sp. cx-55]|uniref:hypothetical protein n=1 Tax=Microbacterium sp. cx-55 TaxID=2875948 RepID=UPI001CBAB60E|nr:hypothetical protein [Microbacterium sp. cx-55]MBZ4488108.1 hypothetical protein [Microbacterium sp. cx-55]UGB34483.1 hypothetical protein LQ938_11455 [Microbacterium sp. cx-55]